MLLMSRSIWSYEPTIYQLNGFWLKLVMFWDVNPNTPVVWTVELYLPFPLFSCINLVGVLRASGSLSYELRRVAVEFSLNDLRFR